VSKHTISMKDDEWYALVDDSIRATVRLSRVVSVSEYIRIIAAEARSRDGIQAHPPQMEASQPQRGPLAQVAAPEDQGLIHEQSTRTNAQPTGQSGGAGRSDAGDAPGGVVPRVRKAGKRAAGKKGASPQAEGVYWDRESVAYSGGVLVKCLRCGAPGKLAHAGYCSAGHRLADEQEKRR
jgi:hypothetical protein